MTKKGKVLNTSVHCLLSSFSIVSSFTAFIIQLVATRLPFMPFSRTAPLNLTLLNLFSSQRKVPLKVLPTPGSIVAYIVLAAVSATSGTSLSHNPQLRCAVKARFESSITPVMTNSLFIWLSLLISCCQAL